MYWSIPQHIVAGQGKGKKIVQGKLGAVALWSMVLVGVAIIGVSYDYFRHLSDRVLTLEVELAAAKEETPVTAWQGQDELGPFMETLGRLRREVNELRTMCEATAIAPASRQKETPLAPPVGQGH